MDQIVLSKQQENQLKDQGGRYTDEQDTFGAEPMEEEIDEIQFEGEAKIPVDTGRHRIDADEIAQQREIDGISDMGMKASKPHELIEQGAEQDSREHEQEQFKPAMLEVSRDDQGRGTLFVFFNEPVTGEEYKDRDTDPPQERKDFPQRIPEAFLTDSSQKFLRPGRVEGTLILGGETESGLVQEIMEDDGENRQAPKFIALFSGERHWLFYFQYKVACPCFGWR